MELSKFFKVQTTKIIHLINKNFFFCFWSLPRNALGLLLNLCSSVTHGGSGDHMGYRGTNPDRPYARLKPYLLHYHFGPKVLYVCRESNEIDILILTNRILFMKFLFCLGCSSYCSSWKQA